METIVLKNSKALQLTDEEFLQFCAEHRDLRIERDADKQIYIMSPTFTFTGEYDSEINFQLRAWNKKHGLGYCFGSSAGFTLPSGAMRSPDAAWIKKERWEKLSLSQKESFAPLCPDFIIELRSKTDSLKTLQNKMQEWLDNGCRLGWLIDLKEQKTYVYKSNEELKIIDGFDNMLSGQDVLPGFELDLKELKS